MKHSAKSLVYKPKYRMQVQKDRKKAYVPEINMEDVYMNKKHIEFYCYLGGDWDNGVLAGLTTKFYFSVLGEWDGPYMLEEAINKYNPKEYNWILSKEEGNH